MTKEQKLLASFIVNFKKGLKVDDPIEYAKVCRALVNIYGSTSVASQKLGVGKETVRILTKILELPPEIQQLVSSRKIPLTVAFDLVPLARTLGSKKQIETANAVSGLSFKDARAIIRRVSEEPEKSPLSAREEVMNDLERREINIAIIAIPRKMYDLLQEESKDVPLLISHIVDSRLTEDRTIVSSPINQRQDLVSLTVRFTRKTFMTLRRRTRNPANLVEQIIVDWLKRRGKIE